MISIKPNAILLADSELEWVGKLPYLSHVFQASSALDANVERVLVSNNQQSNLLLSLFGRIIETFVQAFLLFSL